jgi:hypothetical protein
MTTTVGVSGVGWLVGLEDCCNLVLVSCCCWELAAEAQFENPQEGESPLLETITRKLVKNMAR